MKWFERWQVRRLLRHRSIPREPWDRLLNHSPLFRGLHAVEKAHLREQTILFLERKSISGAGGLVVSETMALSVAAVASLPILRLGMEYYRGWSEVILYPTAFRVAHEIIDEAGVAMRQEEILVGEAWERGPVILAWEEVAVDLAGRHEGRNVVLHEFAHKLDMLEGPANGMPPLHSDMVPEQWTRAFSKAFEQVAEEPSSFSAPLLGEDAAASPAEFFAVASECFFVAPHKLFKAFPDVYRQLMLFYRQNPLLRRLGEGRPKAPSRPEGGSTFSSDR